ncbi:MAG: hypothetical protein DELT_02078 [Desulfovibrio sp.]
MAITSILNSSIGSVASSFASDISRRISQSRGLSTVQTNAELDPEAAAAQEEKLGQLGKLESALSATVSYMADTYGEQAASAMIGIVYKSLGDGEINESTLGNALLDVVRFVDSNFGIDEGDSFMDHLNGSLNDSLNAFFDNGQNETFFAASSVSGGSGGGIDLQSMLEDVTDQMAKDIMAMLEEARANPEGASSPVAGYGAVEDRNALQGVLLDAVL